MNRRLAPTRHLAATDSHWVYWEAPVKDERCAAGPDPPRRTAGDRIDFFDRNCLCVDSRTPPCAALPWVAGLGWNASTQTSKLDTLIAANTKLEKRFDDRDIRLDAMRERMYASDRVTDALSLRVTALEGLRK